MNVPHCLLPLHEVVQGSSAKNQSFALAELPASKSLEISLESQALSRWCWASVTSAIEFFYEETYAAQQCVVASRCLFVQCCPPGEDSPQNPYNSTYNLATALGQNAATGVIQSQLTFDDFRSEIANRCPICCIIDWNNGDSHVVLGAGYSDTGDIWINDPAAPGIRAHPWSSFCQLYAGEGHWRHTIKTKKSTA